MEYEIDLDNLDNLLRIGYSFKGEHILVWYVEKKDSDNIDEQLAAKEIYNNYLHPNSKPLNMNNFYYIIYANPFFRGKRYAIVRDKVLSPKYDYSKPPVKYKDHIKLNLNRIEQYKKDILSHKNCLDEDRYKIDNIINLMIFRLNRINIHSVDNIYKAFYSSNSYRKYQIYSIVKNCSLDLKTLYYCINKIRDTD